jgi:hypothetical protein
MGSHLQDDLTFSGQAHQSFELVLVRTTKKSGVSLGLASTLAKPQSLKS